LSGAPIIFLHGLGGNHLSWWQQVPYFMRSFECITVDQRGFSLSPDPDGLFNRAHASDLAASHNWHTVSSEAQKVYPMLEIVEN
jgi:3-oxoadipate enol-lactonase